MSDMGLYYPYIHIRDDTWLKAAALLWPKLGRLVPVGYVPNDSDVARALVDEEFLVDVEARWYDPIASAFISLVRNNEEELRARYGLALAPDIEAVGVGAIHRSKLSQRLIDDLTETGLAREGRPDWLQPHLLGGSVDNVGVDPDSWVLMDRRVAAVYLTMVAGQAAAENDLAVVTDQPDFHGLLSSWSTERLIDLLLYDRTAELPDSSESSADEVAETYAVLAIRSYLPQSLETAPIEKVLNARKYLLPEFVKFREHLEALTPAFAEIAELPDPAVRKAKLEWLLQQAIRVPGLDLEKSLHKAGFEAGAGVLSLETPSLGRALDRKSVV